MEAIANIEEFQKVVDQDKPVLLDFYAVFILKDKEIKEQLIGMQSEQKLETLIQAQLTLA